MIQTVPHGPTIYFIQYSTHMIFWLVAAYLVNFVEVAELKLDEDRHHDTLGVCK